MWLDHGPELLQGESLQGLHDVGRQCHWSVVLDVVWTRRLWNRDDAGRLPQHRDPLETQAHAEDVVKYSTELGCAGFQDLWAHPIWACSLACVESRQLSSYMVEGEGHRGCGCR